MELTGKYRYSGNGTGKRLSHSHECWHLAVHLKHRSQLLFVTEDNFLGSLSALQVSSFIPIPLSPLVLSCSYVINTDQKHVCVTL